MKEPVQDHPGDEVAMVGILGPLRLADVLFIAGKANRIAPLQVLRADRVVGPDHVCAAARHARRALQEGRNQADRLEVEFTRYAAGERQIRVALDKMGVADGTPEAVVVALGPKRMGAILYFLHATGARTKAVEPADPARLASFGITDAQLEATTPERRLDLVLEAVALVDVLR